MKFIKRFLSGQRGEMNTSIMLGVVTVAIAFIMFPIMLTAAHDLQTDQSTETFGVTTTSGTSSTLTLTGVLYKTRVADVVSVSSDDVADTPVVTASPPASNKVIVAGLVTSASRNITLVYDVDALSDYTGMGALVGVAPLIVFVGILGAIVAGAFFAIKGRG